MRVNRRNSIIAFLAAVLALSACTADVVYSHYQPIGGEGWLRSDTICFEAGPVAETGRYGCELCLRTNSLYPFMQLQVVVERQIRPSGEGNTTVVDTVNVDVTDREGMVQGEGICHYLYTIPLSDMQMNSGDTLLFSVRHNMIRHQLGGVTDVGVTIRTHS